jgi:CelD/BcsL family acetyltransferase involved in cellulose biosynthesis
MRGELVEDIEGLEAHRDAWDELAAACARPYSSPAWMLAWWRHARPVDAGLKAVLVWDGARLAGIAPFRSEPAGMGLTQLRVLAAELSGRVAPVARPEEAEAVGAAVMAALAGTRPDIIRLDQLDDGQRWAESLGRAARARRRAWLHEEDPIPAPTLVFGEHDLGSWLSTKSRNFRQKLKQRRRRLEEAGAVFRVSREEDLERDVGALLRLHAGRWEHRGGSDAIVPGIEGMLLQAGRELVGEGRFRLHVIDVGGSVICAQLFVAAGGEIAFWNGGFDEAWARHGPAIVSVIEAIDEGMRRGDDRLDFGAGGQDYKYRLAEGEDTLRSSLVVPAGGRYAVARARLAPSQARSALKQRLSPEQKEKLKRLLGRA